MRLKKLELIGFKSFADRTQVYFDQGVTCVVGPNGCGKSNISDSIRWVLGERSAKLLRGAKMEDVIFAGTQFRKPLSFAEVSLTFDNTDRGLPIDYNEVTITRRLHRSGESEYLINKTQCRLKDIQDLILDTGVGSNSYSMIEQGRIDYILNASADERRFLIEEAAGISKYKLKKEEAIRKLERTEQNLLRLKDIVAEVQRNIQYAERQAKRAQRFQEHFEKLKELETKSAFFDIALITGEREGLEDAIRKERSRIEELLQLITQARQSQEDLNAALEEVLNRYSAEESRRYQIKSKLEQNEQRLRFHQEKRVELATRRGEIQQESGDLRERIVKTQTELEAKNRESLSMEDLRHEADAAYHAASKVLKEVESLLESAKERYSHSKSRALESSSEATRIRNEYHRLCAFLETSQEQKQKHEAGATRYQQEVAQWTARKEDCEKSLQHFEAKIGELSQEKNTRNEERHQYRLRVQEAEGEIEQAERLLHEKETRRQMLKEIDESAGYGQEELLEDLSPEEKALVCHLRDVIHVAEGYEWAVEAILGDFARSLIAEDSQVASKFLHHMIEKKSTPAGFFVRRESDAAVAPSSADMPAHPAIVCALSDAVEIKDPYKGLLTPFFERVYVLESLQAETLPELMPLAKNVRLVTRQGTVLGPSGRVYFRQGVLTSEQSLFKRGAEIEGLGRQIYEVNQTLVQARSAADEYSRKLGAVEADLERIESEYLDAKLQRESYESMKTGMQERLGSYQQELELIFHEREEIKNREEEAIAGKTQLEIDLMRAEEKQRRIRTEQEDLIRETERLEQTKADALRQYADQKANLDNLTQRKRYLEESVSLLKEHERRDSERLENLGQESDRIRSKEADLDKDDEKIRLEQKELTEAASDSDLKLEKIRGEKEQIQADIQALEQTIQNSQEAKHASEEKLHGEEKKIMDLNYQERNIHERLMQAYKIDLAALQAQDFPMTEDERRDFSPLMEELRKKIETIGTVNLLAIEEYDELKERFDFLMNQQKDLEDSKTSLMEAIRKINRTTKGLFESTFENVQNAFKSYYQTLFRGGEAKLILLDESNPLESGIDIVVRPPGKKLQHISLMSGGEKAMTALALLFALFQIKPSPFCVLDEVDAPLDEANVDRFLTVVKPFLQNTQFIIVTHNRKTIAMGDSLYGVTMQEAGVSKIVSVKVSQDAKDEAFERSSDKNAEEEDASVEEQVSS